MRVTALAGGTGAAKFLKGAVQAIDPEDLTVIVNTGDDAVLHGLHISPDIDIVTYTLAGLVDERGWGIAADTTGALDQMRALGLDAWFHLGDRDLGTHLARTTWLSQGQTLSEVTDRIRRALGVKANILPMSDDRVATQLTLVDGTVREFQEYFVKHRHSEQVAEVRFDGAADARPAPGVLEAIGGADLVVICPSNPVISVGPILALPEVRQVLIGRRPQVRAVTPIVEGAALKGPADRLLPVVGAEATARGVAGLYRDFCGCFVLDQRDADLASDVEALDMQVLVTDTVMVDEEASLRLAKEVLHG